MTVPQEFEHAAQSEVKPFKISDKEEAQLLTNPRFVRAAYLSQEVADAVPALRPDLDHHRDESGDLDLDSADISQADEWSIEAHRDLYAVIGLTDDITIQIAQAILGREIERYSVEELLNRKVEAMGGEQ